MINGMIKHLDTSHRWGSGGESAAIRSLDLPITRRQETGKSESAG